MIKCSFCSKSQRDVKFLIATNAGSPVICDECISLCNDILGQARASRICEQVHEEMLADGDAAAASGAAMCARRLRTVKP